MPLQPAAVLAGGLLVPMLARAVAEGVSRGVDLDVHAGDGYLLALGSEEDLPWVDGATWLGRDGSLLVPTTLTPLPDAGLVSRAIARRLGPGSAWIVLLPDRVLVGERSTGLPDVGRLREMAGPAGTP
jgi:hypothetical protein